MRSDLNTHAQNTHPDYSMLVLMADGEADAARAAALSSHLETCPECRARMTALQSTSHEFAAARSESFDSLLQPAEAARARLKTQLSVLAANERQPLWNRLLPIRMPVLGWGYLTSAAAVPALIAVISIFPVSAGDIGQGIPGARGGCAIDARCEKETPQDSSSRKGSRPPVRGTPTPRS